MTNVPKQEAQSTPWWQNLAQLFEEFSQSSTEYLQYDSGYRRWKYSYAQVRRAAKHFAARLKENDIRKGDKVLFWSENRPEWVAAFWGCILAGVVVVPIDYRASTHFVRHIHKIVDARVLLVGEEVEPIVGGAELRIWRLSDLEWTDRECEAPRVPIDRDHVVEIVFTSGATGQPKGVLITHRNILANIASPLEIISTYRRWFLPFLPIRFLSLIPLSHMFGQAIALFILPFIPGTAVLMHGYSPYEIVRQIRARRVAVVVCVPKILELLRKYIQLNFPDTVDPAPASSHWIFRWWHHRRLHWFLGWRFCAFVVGAAPLAKELESFWSRLGFAMVQGYGLTETAPIVAFNNPFDTKEGTVGTPIAGVEVKIAPDGEILVRGENVTPGYYQVPPKTASAFENGWFHTGDIGSFDDTGHLIVRGRKKEMIVTPEGMNVFPEDVEDVLNRVAGVKESAVVGPEQVHAVLVLGDGVNPSEVLLRANQQLEAHQRIRGVSIWPGERLPRTESTHKLKRKEIQTWIETGQSISKPGMGGDTIIDLLQRYAPDQNISPASTLDQLGLSSLDRVELLLDLERKLGITIDEALLTGDRTVSAIENISVPPVATQFPTWNRLWIARAIRYIALAAIFLPFVRIFARARISGREHLASLRGPVVFAPNHQSHLDTPLILSALLTRYRYKVAPAMWKEYFDAYFSPERHARYERLRDSVLYRLVALFFNAFPIPQTQAGAGQSLRYLGDLVSQNWSILFFPEGERTEAGEIKTFQPGIGLIAARLGIPVVPIRLRGVEKVLHRGDHWPHRGPVEIRFGPPLYLKGRDPIALAKLVEEAVLAL
jgi:long-chain acyl-CoA synthetase